MQQVLLQQAPHPVKLELQQATEPVGTTSRKRKQPEPDAARSGGQEDPATVDAPHPSGGAQCQQQPQQQQPGSSTAQEQRQLLQQVQAAQLSACRKPAKARPAERPAAAAAAAGQEQQEPQASTAVVPRSPRPTSQNAARPALASIPDGSQATGNQRRKPPAWLGFPLQAAGSAVRSGSTTILKWRKLASGAQAQPVHAPRQGPSDAAGVPHPQPASNSESIPPDRTGQALQPQVREVLPHAQGAQDANAHSGPLLQPRQRGSTGGMVPLHKAAAAPPAAGEPPAAMRTGRQRLWARAPLQAGKLTKQQAAPSEQSRLGQRAAPQSLEQPLPDGPQPFHCRHSTGLPLPEAGQIAAAADQERLGLDECCGWAGAQACAPLPPKDELTADELARRQEEVQAIHDLFGSTSEEEAAEAAPQRTAEQAAGGGLQATAVGGLPSRDCPAAAPTATAAAAAVSCSLSAWELVAGVFSGTGVPPGIQPATQPRRKRRSWASAVAEQVAAAPQPDKASLEQLAGSWQQLGRQHADSWAEGLGAPSSCGWLQVRGSCRCLFEHAVMWLRTCSFAACVWICWAVIGGCSPACPLPATFAQLPCRCSFAWTCRTMPACRSCCLAWHSTRPSKCHCRPRQQRSAAGARPCSLRAMLPCPLGQLHPRGQLPSSGSSRGQAAASTLAEGGTGAQ